MLIAVESSVENLEKSWLWMLPGFREVRDVPGVHFVRIRFSNFGVPISRPALFLHNVAAWHEVAKVSFPWRGPGVPC